MGLNYPNVFDVSQKVPFRDVQPCITHVPTGKDYKERFVLSAVASSPNLSLQSLHIATGGINKYIYHRIEN